MMRCGRGTGLWRQRGVPHRGWRCTSIEDLGEPDAICQMCQFAEIRFAHFMQHPKYPKVLACGVICAGAMAEDYTGAVERERELRNRAGRRTRWLTRRWRMSQRGNEYLRCNGYHIVVFRKFGGWSGRIEHGDTDSEMWLPKVYHDADEAKLAAFDMMNKHATSTSA